MKAKPSEAKIAEMYKEGRGQGQGQSYLPWLRICDLSSKGRSHRPTGRKTKREHHLLSDVEHARFIGLEWAREVVDINEQFPLDRQLTMGVAKNLRLRHPCYPGTHIPTVMTVDFMATIVRDGTPQWEAFDTKEEKDVENENVIEKLEIVREVLSLMECKHHLVIDSNIPKTEITNIEWFLLKLPPDDELARDSAYWTPLKVELTEMIRSCRERLTLAQLCARFDGRVFREPGMGLKVAKLLMYERVLKAPLSKPDLHKQQVSEFVVTTSPGQMFAMGAAA